MTRHAQPKSGARSRNPATARHSAARLAAVQALYQIEITGADPGATVEEFRRHRLGAADPEVSGGAKANAALFAALVAGVAARRDEIDALLASVLAAGWRLERLEVILRCILRLGAFELLARPQVPARVVVNEHLTLAHAFFAGAEPGMVNGILDRLARRLRPGELETGGERRPAPPR